ncbi:hypothetical protein GCM10010315_59720 [Streptomyces luteosporeus]|uniref:Uncharacterized protein n=1 Tax=Streptomyces luteosporeus TaxID=173856 RepID=A0ABN3U9K4_9ACTN
MVTRRHYLSWTAHWSEAYVIGREASARACGRDAGTRPCALRNRFASPERWLYCRIPAHEGGTPLQTDPIPDPLLSVRMNGKKQGGKEAGKSLIEWETPKGSARRAR